MTNKIVTKAIEDSLFEIGTSVEDFVTIDTNEDFSHFLFHGIDYWEFNRNRIKNAAEGKEING